jgi:ribosomal-protein-alanine N-acetyltransferase
MSHQLDIEQAHLYKIGLTDLDQLLAIETKVYPYPWSRGNFFDSFNNGHELVGLRDKDDTLFAYFIVMYVVDEVHLLNIAVDTGYQQKGYAHFLLNHLCELAREKGMVSVLLEVRVSNLPALKLYQKFGFIEIGRRKNYYPAQNQTREDAIVMRYTL